MIKISLNNEATELPSSLSIATALDYWGYSGEQIAVAVNNEFVPRSQYQSYQLEDNDAIDIVSPVQGG